MEENKVLYKKQRNKCVYLHRRTINVYFNKVTKAGVPTNEHFWKLSKSFLTNKRFLENAEIMLRIK